MYVAQKPERPMAGLVKRHMGKLLLIGAALIWGFSFVFTRMGLDDIPPFTFNALRSLIGSAVLFCYMAFTGKGHLRLAFRGAPKMCRGYVVGGLACAVALWAASTLQMVGVSATTAGKAGFITSCYVVFVPVVSLLIGKKCPTYIWIGVTMAVTGLFLLCAQQDFSFQSGDIPLMLCALCFAVHFLVVSRYSSALNGVALSCAQFFFCGLVSLIPMMIWERPSLAAVKSALVPLLYSGVMTCGLGHTFQVIGQKTTSASVASLLCSLESVFAALAGWICLNQRLSLRELCGCGVLLAAVLFTQGYPALRQSVSTW